MVESASPSGAGVKCCQKAKITVDLAALEFLDDHALLKDAWKGPDGKHEWRDTGTLFTHPDWEWTSGTKPNPVSFSMVKSLDVEKRDPVGGDKAKRANREKMRVAVYLKVGGGQACPDKCSIRARYTNRKGKRISLFQSGWITLKPQTALRKIEIQSKFVLPRRISRRKLILDWEIRSSKKSGNPAFTTTTGIGRTSNERLITFRKPLLAGNRESGVTLARMRRSVDWVGSPKSTDHRKIINHLFGKFDAYTLVTPKPTAGGGYELGYSNLSREEKRELKRKPKLFKRLGDLGWSGYFKDAGAWPAADPQLVRWGAECQAICRLAIGMLHQLGSDADIELVYAWADFSDPNKAVARTPADLQSERDAGRSGAAEPTGPDPSKSYVMVDAPVEKGKYYLPPVLDPKDGRKKVPRGPHYRSANSIGWNNFEAYARYRYKTLKGKQVERYYGGGVGEHSGNLVHVFEGIAEYDLRNVTVLGQLLSVRYITGYYDYRKKKYM